MATKLLTPLTQQRKTELDTNFKEPKEIEFMMTPSTLETVDRAFFQYVDKDIDAHTSTSEVFKKVPVIWQTAERSFQIKNNKIAMTKILIMTMIKISLQTFHIQM